MVLGLAALVLTVAAACGGDDEDGAILGGFLTDPSTVPIATPWPQPPEPIPLEEDAIAPLVPGGEQEEEEGAAGETYIVQPGDSPFSICEQFGCDFQELMELNGITDATTLQVGQELKIPVASP
jgi:LysM repeat protein